MAASPIAVNVPTGLTYVVNITGGTVYTDGTLVTAVTFPQTISATTLYYSNGPGTYTLSCTFGGVELMGGQVVANGRDYGIAVSPVPSTAQLARAEGGFTGSNGTGTPDPLTGSGATVTPQLVNVAQGSDGSPVTAAGPTVRIGRVEQLNASTIGGSGTKLTNEANSALVVTTTGSGGGSAGTFMQACAIFAYANASGAGTWDAIGFNAVGRTVSSSTRRGTGGYFEGRTDATGGTLVGAEIRANNQKSSNVPNDSLFRGTGQSDTAALFVSSAAAGTANPTIAAGIQIYSADGVGQFGVGIGIASTGVNAIDTRSGTFSDATIALGNAQKIGWENSGGSGTLKCLYVDSSNRLNLDNNQDPSAGILITNLTHIQFSTGTGSKIGTATGQKFAFWNQTPTVQPSAVGTATGYAAGATVATFHSDDTYTGNTGSTAYTINGIVNALKTVGLIAL